MSAGFLARGGIGLGPLVISFGLGNPATAQPVVPVAVVGHVVAGSSAPRFVRQSPVYRAAPTITVSLSPSTPVLPSTPSGKAHINTALRVSGVSLEPSSTTGPRAPSGRGQKKGPK